jgi:hypothetical protein
MATNYQTKFSVGRVDTETATLYGVCLLKTGEAVGHNVLIDAKSLQTVLTACKRKKALRVKLDHQNSASAFVGTLSNYRIENNDCIRADLELLKTSEYKDYVLEISSRMPNEFGLSIEFENDPKTIGGKDYVRCKSISGAAIVADPAATTGLFSEGGLTAPNVSTVVPAQVVPSGHKRKGQSVPTCETCNEHEQLLSKLADLHNMAADKLDAMVNAQDVAERDRVSSANTEAEFEKRFAAERLELEANLERKASLMACKMLGATEISLKKIFCADTAFATGDILSQLDRITEPSEKTRFFTQNKDKIVAAYNRVAARKVELENRLKALYDTTTSVRDTAHSRSL